MAEQKLPAAIQRQIDQAAEIERQLLEEQGQAPAPEQGTPESSPPPETEPNDPTLGEPPEPPVGEPSSEDAKPEDPPKPTKREAELEQKLRTLNGKYTSEVPALSEQIREEAEKRRALEEELKALREKKETPPEKPREALVTTKDEDEYGRDMLDFVSRAVKDEIYGPLTHITRSIKALEDVVKNLQTLPSQVDLVHNRMIQTEQMGFWEKLELLVPEWQKIDEDPSWIEFLDSRPGFSTKTYRALANEAITEMQPEAIVGLVNEWKRQTGQTEKKSKAEKTQKNLESRVTPEKASSGSPRPAEPVIWTEQEYANAFDPRYVRGKSEKEIADLQAAADLALREGRIR